MFLHSHLDAFRSSDYSCAFVYFSPSGTRLPCFNFANGNFYPIPPTEEESLSCWTPLGWSCHCDLLLLSKKKILFTTHPFEPLLTQEKKGWLFLELSGPRLKPSYFSSCLLWGKLSPSPSDSKYEFSIIPNHLSYTHHSTLPDPFLFFTKKNPEPPAR